MSRLLTAGVLQQAANVQPEAFSMQINTELAGSANDTFILPTADVTNITVDWGDNTTDNYTTAGDKTHVYASPGIYTINITGTAGKVVQFGDLNANPYGDLQKVIKVFDFGNLGWANADTTFLNCINLTEINTLTGDWCQNVTSFIGFAQGCSSLTVLSANNWNTANAITFIGFILNCSSLTTLDVSTWNTSNVTKFSRFAEGCSSLTTLDVSLWNTINVTNFSRFAQDCSSLTTLDVSLWNTGKVTTFSYFAQNCSLLSGLDVSGWNTESVTTFFRFIFNCASLTTLDVSLWNTINVTNFSLFAQDCSSLTTLDVSLWNTGKVTTFFGFVYRCNSLNDLPAQNWNIPLVVDFKSFATNVAIPTITYDQILVNWDAQRTGWTNLANLEIHFGLSKYTLGSAAETARANMIANGVTNLIDGGGI